MQNLFYFNLFVKNQQNFFSLAMGLFLYNFYGVLLLYFLHLLYLIILF